MRDLDFFFFHTNISPTVGGRGSGLDTEPAFCIAVLESVFQMYAQRMAFLFVWECFYLRVRLSGPGIDCGKALPSPQYDAGKRAEALLYTYH